MKLTISLLALVGLAFAAGEDISITAKGSKFFLPNGDQFFMKGITYQQDPGAAGHNSISTAKYIDPLADEKSCKRDVPILQDLGVNCIRVYSIDPKLDHSYCMDLMLKAGIYVITDLSEPAISINRDSPAWTTRHFQRYKEVIDLMAPYPNVIGFFAGNEVTNNIQNTAASAFVKAAVRDTKKYIKKITKDSNRYLGVGYATSDDDKIREDIALYFNCGKQEEAIDFWGHNIYSWCGESSVQESGYDRQAKFFESFNVPVFFAEFGCNTRDYVVDGSKRVWTDAIAILNDTTMLNVFSGGLAYMYFQETNDFGIVDIDGDKVIKRPDYKYLKRAYNNYSPKGVTKDSYQPSGKPASCPSISATWKAAPQLPPTPDKELCKCMVEASECTVSDKVAEDDYGKLFGSVCGMGSKICAGIGNDTELGNYGSFSMCMPSQQLTNALDNYYLSQNKADGACKWGNKGVTKSAKTDDKCAKKLKAAEAYNKRIAGANDTIPAPEGDGDADSDADSLGARSTPLGVFAAGALAVIVAMLV